MVRGDQQRERVRRFQVCYIYEDSITKRRRRGWEYNGGGGGLVQSTLYACMELSQ
jgi:hypothetical protein